jgi:hypothetical protein
MLINQEWFQHKGIYNFIITDTFDISYDYLDNDGLVQHKKHPHFEFNYFISIEELRNFSSSCDYVYVLSDTSVDKYLNAIGLSLTTYNRNNLLVAAPVKGVLIGPPNTLQRMWLRFLRNKNIKQFEETISKIKPIKQSFWDRIKTWFFRKSW